MKRASPIIAAPLGALMLSACAASDAAYPSLAIRDVERGGTTDASADPAPTRTPISGDPAIESQIAGLAEQLSAAHVEFLKEVPRARRLLSGTNGGPGSDSWGAAQVALASLEARRSVSAVVLADLDRIYAEAQTAYAPLQAIADTRMAAQLVLGEEDAVLAELRGMLE